MEFPFFFILTIYPGSPFVSTGDEGGDHREMELPQKVSAEFYRIHVMYLVILQLPG